MIGKEDTLFLRFCVFLFAFFLKIPLTLENVSSIIIFALLVHN